MAPRSRLVPALLAGAVLCAPPAAFPEEKKDRELERLNELWSCKGPAEWVWRQVAFENEHKEKLNLFHAEAIVEGDPEDTQISTVLLFKFGDPETSTEWQWHPGLPCKPDSCAAEVVKTRYKENLLTPYYVRKIEQVEDKEGRRRDVYTVGRSDDPDLALTAHPAVPTRQRAEGCYPRTKERLNAQETDKNHRIYPADIADPIAPQGRLSFRKVGKKAEKKVQKALEAVP